MKKKFDKEVFKQEVRSAVRSLFRKELDDATKEQLFQAVSSVVEDWIVDDWIDCHKASRKQDAKILYYLSMEFLEGRALGNNLINLCRETEVKKALSELGLDLNTLEDQEPDPALGNGGLGRLAACFLDSLSTLSYPAYGCGIRYRYGLFRQKIENGFQVEVPDNWLKNGYPFEIKRSEYACEVKFGGYVDTEWDGQRVHFVQKGYQSVRAVPYDIPIVGYNNSMVNTLRVWDAEPIEAFKLDEFDKGNYDRAVAQANLAKTIVDVLYPNDNHISGKELRLRQQYFFVSASLQRAIRRFMETHSDIHDLPNKAVFHMNDTHPTLAVPELMRILLDGYHLEWDDAWYITTHSCAFTNHTIMSEALEKWPVDLFQRLLPRIYQIVEEMNRRFALDIDARYGCVGVSTEKHRAMDILWDGKVRMANMAIIGSYSVNGVAAIHTEILEKEVFKDFYELWPEKFSNKTNGITQRRFMLHANPLLSDWITKHIGKGWITKLTELKKLEELKDDKKALEELKKIKYENKVRLAGYIKEHNGIEVDPNSIFDVQVKRLHEYKRQLMNILHVMYLYNQLKENPELDIVPRTFIFGAKAAPGYYRAKMTIKLINAVADVVNNDKTIGDKLKVVFIEDYKVSNAELIFPAADVSEQISTASKEASGTSNMKFMLNGALTLGTMDGANIEIVAEAGKENAFIFGLSADEVIRLEKDRSYEPMEIFNSDPEIRKVLMQLVNGFYSPDDTERFRDIYNSLLNRQSAGGIADQYFILKDFRSYCEAHNAVDKKYRDQDWWVKASLINIANGGKFSSDRTIEEYAEEIWHLEQLTLGK
ncbi:MAG: glycogen/starch/alpha-glucan phosphorylase [Eubacteriales bacterium]|nr:glycogen/starch/alpha-glucan phosphorylase [Eubacteriales bacterium]